MAVLHAPVVAAVVAARDPLTLRPVLRLEVERPALAPERGRSAGATSQPEAEPDEHHDADNDKEAYHAVSSYARTVTTAPQSRD